MSNPTFESLILQRLDEILALLRCHDTTSRKDHKTILEDVDELDRFNRPHGDGTKLRGRRW
jgi:hypothetical protein